MATQITNYQCPACTGPLQFSPETGKLKCEYCESIFELADIEALYKAKEEAAAEAEAAKRKKKNVKCEKIGNLKLSLFSLILFTTFLIRLFFL